MKALTADPAIAQKMVVVLKTEGSVLMPWLDKIPALVEAWYPGQEDGIRRRQHALRVAQSFGQAADDLRQYREGGRLSTPEQFPGLLVPGPHWATVDRSSLLNTPKICRWAIDGTRPTV